MISGHVCVQSQKVLLPPWHCDYSGHVAPESYYVKEDWGISDSRGLQKKETMQIQNRPIGW